MPDIPFPTPAAEFDDFKNQVWEMFRQLFEENYGGYKVGEEIAGISSGIGTTVEAGDILYYAGYYGEQEETTTSLTFERIKILKLNNAGEYKIKFAIKETAGETGTYQIYRKGAPIAGASTSHTGTTYTTKTIVVSGWSAGDTLEIWGKLNQAGTAYVKQLRLYTNTYPSLPIALDVDDWPY